MTEPLLFVFVFLDGSGSYGGVFVFGKAHEDNTLGGASELGNAGQGQFDDLARGGSDDNLINVLSDT
jgi:hypothetical protein